MLPSIYCTQHRKHGKHLIAFRQQDRSIVAYKYSSRHGFNILLFVPIQLAVTKGLCQPYTLQ